MITSWGDPALGGVYKLVAVCDDETWKPAIKISESPEKTPNPGNKRVWRLYDRRGKATADLLSLNDEDPASWNKIFLRHPSDPIKCRTLNRADISEIEPMLVDVLKEGKLVYNQPEIQDMRKIRQADIERLDPGVRRIVNPHIYHVSLTEKLWSLKRNLIEQALPDRNQAGE